MATEQILAQHSSPDRALDEAAVRALLHQAWRPDSFAGKRLLVIVPDGTRSAPIALFFRLLYELLGEQVEALDYLIALGTHRPMSGAAIDHLVGVEASERARRFPKSRVFNHEWWRPDTFFEAGTVEADEVVALSHGLLHEPIAVRLNRALLDYDETLILGPVFPHEVAGFSGGAKYLFPGVAEAEVIDKTHWIGALATSIETIGVADTAVRRLLHRGAQFVLDRRPVSLIALVMRGHDLHGLFIGDLFAAWRQAAQLSAALNIHWFDRPVQTVLSMPSTRYEDLWTAAKAMYKTEPVVTDGGEVIIYAPHLSEISFTHGEQIRAVGYHVRDYFAAQWEHFRHLPWGVLAHSTHVRGAGTFVGGVERPRIRVTLATAIPESTCCAINLGYRDPATIEPATFAADPDALVVENAGEVLYRLRNSSDAAN